MGERGAFVRLPAADGTGMVAVHACFPHTLWTSVKQKSRWITGISLAGWDRLGWQGGLTERWMRLRDRRALLAALILATAYAALPMWLLARVATALAGRPMDASIPMPLVAANLSLLGWRVAMRAAITLRSHGWRMAMLAPIHMLIGNVVAMLAAWRALTLYAGLVHHGRLRWDKTAHVFPSSAPHTP
jgi:bacteriophage N4 adsorption protein B